jgi:flagellar biosynthesis protein FlhB
VSADDRVLPPSARRVALARRAGLVPRSAILVAGAAWTGAAIGLWLAASRARALLASSFVTATTATDGSVAPPPTAADLVVAVLGVAAPLVAGAALAAVAAHLAQTRQLAIPRRVIPGAPRPARGIDRRAADVGLAGLRAVAVAAVAVAWTWTHLADLGRLAGEPAGAALAGATALLVSALAHLAAALLAVGALDLLVAVLRHRADLRMTRTEAADDARAAGIDPRWRRARLDRGAGADAVRTARLVVAGDGATAIRWHETLWPVPTILATGRGLDATRLLELARRHHVAIHHAPALARGLGTLAAGAAVPDALRPALAELVAADGEARV